MAPVRPQTRQSLEKLLSASRLEPYLTAVAGDVKRAIALYEWNLTLSAEFWKVIAITEVTLRNAMHNELAVVYGDRWFDNPKILDDRSLAAIRKARQRARRSSKATNPPPGKVISEITFGAWVALLDQGGHSTELGDKIKYQATLWDPALRQAFPNGPHHRKKTNRGLRDVQMLRNRISHHEKIFSDSHSWTERTLEQLYEHCTTVAGWISTDAQAWVSAINRFESVMQEKP